MISTVRCANLITTVLISGLVKDSTDNYIASMSLLEVCLGMASTLWLVLLILQRRKSSKASSNNPECKS